jgi:ketosteroid isomerase-like protein
MTLADEMKALLEAFYTSFESGDGSTFRESFGPDILIIGTDELEWWKGKPEAQRVVRAQLDEMRSTGVRVTGGDPDITVKGDVVWAADRPTLRLGDGTQTELRLTAVAVREGENLLLQQVHASVGTPNEEVVKQELTL